MNYQHCYQIGIGTSVSKSDQSGKKQIGTSLLPAELRQKQQSQLRGRHGRTGRERPACLTTEQSAAPMRALPPSAAQEHTDACLLLHSRSHKSTVPSRCSLSLSLPLSSVSLTLFLHLCAASPTSTTDKPAPLNMIYSSIIKGQRLREKEKRDCTCRSRKEGGGHWQQEEGMLAKWSEWK